MAGKFLCTDCGDHFKFPRHDHRCPMCGSARIVEEISQSKTKVGDVAVTFTVGRIGALQGREN